MNSTATKHADNKMVNNIVISNSIVQLISFFRFKSMNRIYLLAFVFLMTAPTISAQDTIRNWVFTQLFKSDNTEVHELTSEVIMVSEGECYNVSFLLNDLTNRKAMFRVNYGHNWGESPNPYFTVPGGTCFNTTTISNKLQFKLRFNPILYTDPLLYDDLIVYFVIKKCDPSTVACQTISPVLPLPIELIHFTANCDQKTTLSWTTASEQNSDRFIVEKSRDGRDWSFVAEQVAAGNSNTMITYHQTDENPMNGVNYYRLRQVDLNGVEQIYGPISTSCSGNENNSMTVYPNPNNGAFTVEISSTKNHTGAQLVLTDMIGRTVVSQMVNITAGTNQIMISNGDLQMGTYMVTVHGIDSELKPVKVVVNQ